MPAADTDLLLIERAGALYKAPASEIAALSNFASQTANTFLAAPSGAPGSPTFRAILAADVPTLNQNTTGSAATLTTSRNFSITGGGITAAAVGFNGSGAVVLNASVDAGHITLARMANLAANSIIGNNTGSPATPLALTTAQVRTLINVADGATANATDASLRDRATHTGTQAISTVTGLQTALDAKQATLSGAVLTSATVAGTDKVLVQDASDADNLKTVTAQSIADLAAAGATAWGDITGTLSGQTDLQSALDTKANTSTIVSAGTGLTGGGSLVTNRTISANVATQAEAEAGASSTKLMTPQRTAQAIAALAGGGGDWTQIGSTINTTSGSSWNFTSIPQTYHDLMLAYEGLDSTSTFTVNMEVSVNNGSSYGGKCVHNSSSTTAAYGFFKILGYRNNPFARVIYGLIRSDSAPTVPTVASPATSNNRSGIYVGSSAIDAIRLGISTGAAHAGTLKLYGK